MKSPNRFEPGGRGRRGPCLLGAALLLLLSWSGAAWSQDWPKAEAFAAGTAMLMPSEGERDVEGGIALIREAAEAGNAQAQYALALLYRQGGLIAKSESRARELLERSAGAGVPEAQALLGEILLEEIGEFESADPAQEWLRRAAKQGHVRAHASLGKSYLDRAPREYQRAIEHLTVAAEAGLPDAQLMLGIAYYNGGALYRSRAEPDHRRGYEWIVRAAQAGVPLAWTWIGWAYKDGKAVPQDLERAAAAWYRAAELGDPPGANALALAYRDGIGVPRDRQMYVAWSNRAAELGHAGAREARERRRVQAEAQRQQAVGALILLGLVMGGGGDAPSSGGFMDPTDPMQFWGMDILTRPR